METTQRKVTRPPTQYETLLIADPSFEKEQADQLVEKFNATLQRYGGKLLRSTDWGKRRLAYEIKKHQEGYYLLFEFEGTLDVAKKCESYLNLQSTVLRHMTVKRAPSKSQQPTP